MSICLAKGKRGPILVSESIVSPPSASSVFLPSVLFLSMVDDTIEELCRLRTSLCLQFKPHHIAAGAIFLAAKFLKVKLPSDGDKVWWQEFDVTPRQLEGQFFQPNLLLRLSIHW